MPESENNSGNGCCGLKGCALWGCLTILIIGILGVAISVFAVNKAVNTLNAHLDDEPAEFTLPEPTGEEVASAEEKGASLQSAIENHSGGTFSFTGAEINALISKGLENQSATKIKARVTIADGVVRGEISVPINELLPKAQDKHLNGEATFQISKAHGSDRLKVNLTDLKVKGDPISESIMSAFRATNLADDLYTNPKNHEARKILDGIDSIRVEGDRIVFTVTDGQPQDADKTPAK